MAFLCIKKIFSWFCGTAKWNTEHCEGSLAQLGDELWSPRVCPVPWLRDHLHCFISNSSVEVEPWCQTAFFISFLSTLLIAWGTGGEWSFYMLGVFFNTALLSPLFASLLASQVVWNQVSFPLYIWNAAFCIHAHTCYQKFNLCSPF